MNQRTVTLNNGNEIPLIGLGTCNINISFYYLYKINNY